MSLEDFTAEGGMTQVTEDTVRVAMQDSKREQESHGHGWDISDVMASLKTLGIETHDEIARLVQTLYEQGVIEIQIRPRQN